MAKKKRKSGKTKRRVSGIGLKADHKLLLERTLGVLGGVITARFGETYASKQLTTVSAKTVSIGEMAIGGIAAYFSKQPFIQGVGMGVFAAGAANMMKSMGWISGVNGPITYSTIPATQRRMGQPDYGVQRVGNNGTNAMYSTRNIIGRGVGRVNDIKYAGAMS